MTDTPDLVDRLRLLEAWRKPAGPTPKDKMPNTYKTVKEAADQIEALRTHAEAMAKALEHLPPDRRRALHRNPSALAAYRSAFPGEG